MPKYYEKKITVFCSKCGRIDEKDTEFINIEEDFQGADKLTFRCKACKTVSTSRRYS